MAWVCWLVMVQRGVSMGGGGNGGGGSCGSGCGSGSVLGVVSETWMVLSGIVHERDRAWAASCRGGMVAVACSGEAGLGGRRRLGGVCDGGSGRGGIVSGGGRCLSVPKSTS